MKKIVFSLAIALFTSHAFAVGHIGHLARIDVYDRAQQRNLPVHWHQGKAWVVGNPGNEYQIAIRNQAGQDVLAVVSVDGVNVVSGETANTHQGGYVVDAWQHLDVTGWRKNLSRTAAFYFTSLGDSYAARTGRPNHVGVIGVAMYRRRAELLYDAPPIASIAPRSSASEARPRTEGSAQEPMRTQEKSLDSTLGASPADRLGTGHGRNESSPARYTGFERATSTPEEVVTIYYDSRVNLVARGVIRETSWREPHPFPGPFVRDPPN